MISFFSWGRLCFICCFAPMIVTQGLVFGVNEEITLTSSYLQQERSEFLIIKSTPKFNSHCHLGGEIPMETLLKYANEEQAVQLHQAVAELALGKDYEKAFGIFPLVSQIINTHEKIKEATYQTCQRFKSDHNQVVLLRTGLKCVESKSCEDYLMTVLEGMQLASDSSFKGYLMLSVKRSSTPEMAQLTVDLALKYKTQGIVGIDISDISTVGNIENILPILIEAKQNGLKIAVHMGETSKEKDQMLILQQLEPDLIDHGVNLCDEAKAFVKQRKIPVTVCLTSSIATKMHSSLQKHPWIEEHLKSGHPIHLGTDDSTIFGNITLSSEYMSLLENELEFQKIMEIIDQSFEASEQLLMPKPAAKGI